MTTATALAARVSDMAVRRSLNGPTASIVFGAARAIETSTTVQDRPTVDRARSIAFSYLAGYAARLDGDDSLAEFVLAFRTVEEALR